MSPARPEASSDRLSSTTDWSAVPPLPPQPPRSHGTTAAVVAAGLAAALAAGFGLGRATASGTGGEGPAPVTVKIGTTEASSPWWPPLQKLAKEKGITIEVVNFSDYTQANPALAQKQTDLNLFQHLQFLATYNVNDKQTLTPIGSTVVVPLPLYSAKHQALNQIPQGGKVAIPNDPTNQARALLVLQQAGLLKLKGGGNANSTPAQIEAASSRVSVVPVDAAQTVAALPSVDGAVINNNFAADAKLDPKKALFRDDPARPEAQPYINVFVSRAEDADNPSYATIARLYHDPSVTAAVRAQTKNTAVLVNRPAAQLRSVLAGLQKDLGGAA